MLLHDAEELDDDLGAGADQDLTLATLLGIVDALKSIVQHANTDHISLDSVSNLCVLVRLKRAHPSFLNDPCLTL